MRYLIVHQKKNENVAKILSRMDANARPYPKAPLPVHEHGSQAFVAKQLFMDKRAPFTLLTWVLFLVNAFAMYSVHWRLLFFFMMENRARELAMFLVGGVLGTVLLGRTN